MRFVVALLVILAVAVSGFSQSGSSVIVQSPKANDAVAKVDEVKGICAVKGAVPVVFVKALDGEVWYVQMATVLNGAKFTCNAHFGEAETKKGARFKLVVVAVPAGKVKNFPEGEKVSALPDFPASDPIIVTR